MDLDQIQTDFITAIFGADSEAAIDHVIGDEILTAKQRFGIYSGSVHGILTKSLGLNFPVCKRLVGDEFFDHMCKEFIDQFPPTSVFFAEYGDNFSEFLKDFEPARSLPYLKDVSMLEWARHTVWHKKHPEPFDFSKLTQLSEAQQAKIIFELKPTLRLLQSDYRIDQLWFAHQEKTDIKIEEVNLDESVKLLIWKDIESIKITIMDEEDNELWCFLQAISNQHTATRLAENFGESLPELLNKSIQEGWVQSFTF